MHCKGSLRTLEDYLVLLLVRLSNQIAKRIAIECKTQ